MPPLARTAGLVVTLPAWTSIGIALPQGSALEVSTRVNRLGGFPC